MECPSVAAAAVPRLDAGSIANRRQIQGPGEVSPSEQFAVRAERGRRAKLAVARSLPAETSRDTLPMWTLGRHIRASAAGLRALRLSGRDES